jgi:CheY-like chemotaxis protein
MNSSKELVAKLPMLRRFSRLLLGNQKEGDALVIATLEAFSREIATPHGNYDLKARLYRALVASWRNTKVGVVPAKFIAVEFVQGTRNKNLELSTLSRAVFLLMQLEEFSSETAQWILGLNQHAFSQCLARASEEVNGLLATSVMIIEDEILIAGQLESILQSLGHEVTSVVSTERQAIAAAQKRPPELIVSDIQLADGSTGIDAVAQIMKERVVPTVFITAFPERLLTGLRREPTFLLNKPFRVEQVKAVVSQAVFFDAKIRWKLSNEELSTTLSREWSAA